MIENLNITKSGDVQNKLTGNWLKGDINNCGYRRVQVFKKRFFVHRLVALAYLPNPLNLPCVNHKDGNRLNNHVDNLEWCSASDNQQHRALVLKSGVGSKHTNHKLIETDVIEIRRRLANGETKVSISESYPVSPSLISRIDQGLIWRHI